VNFPEIRRMGVELSSFDSGTGAFEAVACVYGYTDGYNTRFVPGCFAASLRRELPEVRYEHTSRRIGEVQDWRDDAERLTILGQLDPPEGKQRKLLTRAWKGMQTGVLAEFSVGFYTREDRTAGDGVREITRADLDEISLVIEGAVVGAELVATRTAGGGGPIYSRIVNALGGLPAATRSPVDRELLAEADEILRRVR
jgi:HK97 family phage prohead protease